jgi:uncharacterized membrane protein SirB2
MGYAELKALHIACAFLSVGGFAARGALMIRDSPLLQTRFVRIAPHVVDTVLLGSAIALAAWSRQYPFAQGWLTAKVLALLAYVGLGVLALRRGRTRPVRIGAFALALGVALYIVGVAFTRSPMLGFV